MSTADANARSSPLKVGYNITNFDPDTVSWAIVYGHANSIRIRITDNNIAYALPQQQITLASFIDRLRHEIVEDLRNNPQDFENGAQQRHIDWGEVRCEYKGLTFDAATRTCGAKIAPDHEEILTTLRLASRFSGKAFDPLILIDATSLDGAGEPLSLQWTAGEADYYWTRWLAWRHFFVQGYYLARKHGVTSFEFANEPDARDAVSHGWTPERTLEYATLAGDAIQRAIETVNLWRTAGGLASLVPNVMAAGDVGWTTTLNTMTLNYVPSDFYGRPLSTAWAFPYAPGASQKTRFNALSFHNYSSPVFTMPWCIDNPCQPAGLNRIYLTEVNVATADKAKSILHWSQNTTDDVQRALDQGVIVQSLGAKGYSGGYFMKFGQAAYNGLHWSNGSGVGGAKRIADVVRIYAEGFAGAIRKSFTELSPADANFVYDAAYDAARERYAVLSVNKGSAAKLVTVDVTALDVPIASRVFIKEVSLHSRGELIGDYHVVSSAGRRVFAFTQSPQSTAVALIPKSALTSSFQRVTADGYVRGGGLRSQNYGLDPNLYAFARPGSVDNPQLAQTDRRVSYIKVELPFGVPGGILPSNVQAAVLKLTARSGTGESSGAGEAVVHVYGIDDNPGLSAQQWTEGTLRWNVAPNLGGGATALLGRLDSIDSNFVQGVGDTAHMIGTITGNSAGPTREYVDVTDYIRAQVDSTATFMLIREVRYGENVRDDVLTGEPADTVTPGVAYDASADASMWFASKDHPSPNYTPVLELITR